jgi:hypothetical protein
MQKDHIIDPLYPAKLQKQSSLTIGGRAAAAAAAAAQRSSPGGVFQVCPFNTLTYVLRQRSR